MRFHKDAANGRLARWAIGLAFVAIAAAAFVVRAGVSSDMAARGAIASLSDAARAQTPQARAEALSIAKALTRRELELSPARSAAWARLAYAEALEAGRLTPEAVDHIEKSYVVAPTDVDLVLWRAAFVYGNWSQAPENLRSAAFEEVSAFSQFTLHQEAMEAIAPRVADPLGRFALVLALYDRGGAQP